MSRNSTNIKSPTHLISLLICVIPLFFLINAKDVFNFPKLIPFIVLSSGFICAAVLSRNFLTIRNSPKIKLFVIAMGVLVCSIPVVALLSDSTNIRIIWGLPGRANGILFFELLFLLVLVLSLLRIEESYFARFLKWYLITSSIITIYGVIQLIGIDPIKSWNNKYSLLFSTLGNPNFAASYIGIFGVIILLQISRYQGFLRLGIILMFILAIVATFGAQSIQGPLVFGLGSMVIVFTEIKKKYSRKVLVFCSMLAISMILILITSFLGHGPLGARFEQETLKLRLTYWKIAVSVANHFPLTGIGPDSYIEGFRLYRPEELVYQNSDVVADSAHNVILNFLACYGYPVFIIYLIIILFITVVATRNLISYSRIEENVEIRMLSIIWILFLVQSIFSLEQIGLTVVQWCSGGLLLNFYFRGLDSQEDAKKHAGMLSSMNREISVFLMLAIFILVLPFVREEIELQKVTGYEVSAATEQTFFNEIDGKFSNFTKIESRRYLWLSDFLLRGERYNDVEVQLLKIISADPDSYEALEQLARIKHYFSLKEKEIEYRRRILAIDPLNVMNIAALGNALYLNGDYIEAKKYLQKGLRVAPNSYESTSMRDILTKIINN